VLLSTTLTPSLEFFMMSRPFNQPQEEEEEEDEEDVAEDVGKRELLPSSRLLGSHETKDN